MNKLASIAVGLALFVPFISHAQTDDQIRSSLVQQLLSIFTVQVNGIDKMQALVAQSSNPSQFDAFSGELATQLSATTAQLATLLNNSTQTTSMETSSTAPDSVAAGDTTPVCVSTPSLNLVSQKGFVRPYGGYIGDSENIITATYTDTCPVDVTTTYSEVLTPQDGNNTYNRAGTLKDWTRVSDTEYTYDLNYITGQRSAGVDTIVFTVGGVSATTTVSVQ